jgi:hypothetical protein
MPGFFSLEAAKVAMGVVAAVSECVAASSQAYQAIHPSASVRLLSSQPDTIWGKFDHLLYLPLLDLTRPRDLYYYQGQGWQSLYGFTYKYLPLEQFLGQLTRLEVGHPLARRLADCYTQAWYAQEETLFVFADWHVKPHWTKEVAHCGPVTMWGRVMPGTKQLLVNGPQGHGLIGWNYPIDSHFSRVLVDMEAELATIVQRPIAYTIVDSEGSGLPLAHRYAQAQRDYLSVLPRHPLRPLTDFKVQEPWQPVKDDPAHEVVKARWADGPKAETEPRHLILMRPVGQTDPTRIYTGCLPAEVPITHLPPLFRQRWFQQEWRIRELVKGANLNVNYGYTYEQVPHRTRQRAWQEVQEQVEATQTKLAQHRQALTHLRAQLCQLRQTYLQQHTELVTHLQTHHQLLLQRQHLGLPTTRCRQGLARREQHLHQLTTRYQKRRATCLNRLRDHRQQARHLQTKLTQQQATRDAIDTATLCRERLLEKDQIMLNLQLLLLNLHDWAKSHYFAPQWQHLQLATATRLIYQKPGRVRWYPDRIEVELVAYRYADQQRAMAATCDRFNAANLRWRDGRLLRITVASQP